MISDNAMRVLHRLYHAAARAYYECPDWLRDRLAERGANLQQLNKIARRYNVT